MYFDLTINELQPTDSFLLNYGSLNYIKYAEIIRTTENITLLTKV